MMSKYMVSVIIPVYNRAQLVVRTLQSVLAQSLSPIEVILVDNNSSDDTIDVLQAFKRQHCSSTFNVTVAQEKRQGAARARNLGATMASGEWLLFFDSDDTMEPYMLEKYLDVAQRENADMVHREVFQSPYSSDILLTGYFPHENLPELYSAADACVFPSKTEGVGFPVLEAMACGIPVACSRFGALPEVTGDNAVFFDSDSPDEIAEAITRIVRLNSGVNDEFRRELIEKAGKWVASYTWARCSMETLHVSVEAALDSL